MRMGKLMKVAPLLVGLVIGSACDVDGREQVETQPAQEVPPGADTMAGMMAARIVQFQPGPAGGNVAGILRLSGSAGQPVQVNVELTGLAEGEHAWHIHKAKCGEEGPVVVAITPDKEGVQGIGQPLVAGTDGRAAGSVTIPADQLTVEQLQTGQLSLHVHERGGVDHGETVACAPLNGQS